MININGKLITGLVSTFGERPAGTLIALLDSSGSLAISLVNGNAAQILKAQVGNKIQVLTNG
jgi:S-adenosylmethionine hydrolase